jgi:hypothetical protein
MRRSEPLSRPARSGGGWFPERHLRDRCRPRERGIAARRSRRLRLQTAHADWPHHLPPTDPAGNSPGSDTAQKSLPLGKIAVALPVIIGVLFYYFAHHGKKSSTADIPADPADAPNPASVWRDWVLESRRDGYFLYHRELIDHQVAVTF